MVGWDGVFWSGELGTPPWQNMANPVQTISVRDGSEAFLLCLQIM